ncbi:MAG: phosphotransferase [Betaproteobacteria bacterium]|nr:MAG: phosphotransferase [Betaproteobacteria bacterium]
MERLDSLSRWLTSHSSGRRFTLAPVSADASFRRYFRVRFEDGSTLIAMDAPPQQEHSAPFVRVAHIMAKCGLHVPEIVACDLEQGFILLSDLGEKTYLSALDESTADALFDDATTALTLWQLASRKDVLPPYDDKLLWRELDLFPEWYVSKHLGVTLHTSQRETLTSTFELIVKNSLSQPSTFVHRDYMPRNLMVSEPNPGILDFQDAVYGPISYDVVSLFRDAFISWEEERVLDWVVRYWEKARRASLPVRADFGEFYRELEWMGLQRHLKVLGIFARIRYRDGKPAYLEDAPRFLGYIRSVAQRYAALAPLLKLLDQLDDQISRASQGN